MPNVTAKRCNAPEVMLTFSAPSLEKAVGMPTLHNCALVLGVSKSTLSRVDALLIEKRRQLSASE